MVLRTPPGGAQAFAAVLDDAMRDGGDRRIAGTLADEHQVRTRISVAKDDRVAAAAETARNTFEQRGLGESLPSLEVPGADLAAGLPAYELFSRSGLTTSNGEARRLIKGGGARINDQRIEDEARTVTLDDRNPEGIIKLSAGKKRHALIRIA